MTESRKAALEALELYSARHPRPPQRVELT